MICFYLYIESIYPEKYYDGSNRREMESCVLEGLDMNYLNQIENKFWFFCIYFVSSKLLYN